MKFFFTKLMKNSNILPLVAITVYLLLNLFIQLNFSVDVSNSPDETGENLFIHQIAKNGLLPITQDMNLNLKYKNVFAPRGTVVNNEGMVLPLKAIFSSFIYGTNYIYLSNLMDVSKYLILMNTIVLALYILYSYKFILSFKHEKSSLVFICILALVVLSGVGNLVTLYNLFIIIGLFYLKVWFDNNKNQFDKNLFLSSLFFGLVVLLRNELTILFIPFLILFLYLIFFRKYHFNILLFFVFPSIAVANILISNKYYYGNYTTFGYALDSQSREAFKNSTQNIFEKFGKLFLLYGFHPVIAARNFYYYVFSLFYLLLIPALLNISDLKKNLFFILCCGSLVFYILIYYGSNGTFFGNESITFDSSYVRYFSPIYLLLIIYAVPIYMKIIKHFSNSKYFIILLVSLIVTFSIINTYKTNSLSYKNQLGYLDLLSNIKSSIPENSVVFANYWDKLLYKDYKVATFSKKLNTKEDYYNTMKFFYLEHPNSNVYFVPSDSLERLELDTYIRNQKNIKCNNVDILSICKLEGV